jgi:subtilisin family serine protease
MASQKSFIFASMGISSILVAGSFLTYGYYVSLNSVTPVPAEGSLVEPEVSPETMFFPEEPDWDSFNPVDVTVLAANEDPNSPVSTVKESFVLINLTESDKQLLSKSSVEIVYLYESSDKNVVAVQATAIEQLNLEGTIESNQRVSTLNETQTFPPSWGQDRIDSETYVLDNNFTYDTTGKGVTVYVLDTGVNVSHSDFDGRLRKGFTTVNDGKGWDDCNGHGTHVAGTIGGSTFGVAKEVNIVPVRVLNCTGSGYISDIISGLNWIMSNHVGGPAVINMSLGGGYSQILNDTVDSAIRSGFTVVAAAGNSSTDACTFSPASTPDALTIAATGKDDIFASYSNRGSCVDFIAPGSSIVSAYIGSSSAYATLSGTSMAAPHVSAAAARILQLNPSFSPSEVILSVNNLTVPVVKSLPSSTANKLVVLTVADTPVVKPSPEPPEATIEPTEPVLEQGTTTSPTTPAEEPTSAPEPSEPTKPSKGSGITKPNPPNKPNNNLETVDFKSLTVAATTSNVALITWSDTNNYSKVVITVSDNNNDVRKFEITNGVKSLTVADLKPETKYIVTGQGFGTSSNGDFATTINETWFITKQDVSSLKNNTPQGNKPPAMVDPPNDGKGQN